MKKRQGFNKQRQEEKGEKPYENPYPLEKFKRGGGRQGNEKGNTRNTSKSKQSQAVVAIRNSKREPVKEKGHTFFSIGDSKTESAREKARVAERAWEDEQWRECEE